MEAHHDDDFGHSVICANTGGADNQLLGEFIQNLTIPGHGYY